VVVVAHTQVVLRKVVVAVHILVMVDLVDLEILKVVIDLDILGVVIDLDSPVGPLVVVVEDNLVVELLGSLEVGHLDNLVVGHLDTLKVVHLGILVVVVVLDNLEEVVVVDSLVVELQGSLEVERVKTVANYEPLELIEPHELTLLLPIKLVQLLLVEPLAVPSDFVVASVAIVELIGPLIVVPIVAIAFVASTCSVSTWRAFA